MKINDFLQSKISKEIILGTAGLVVLVLVFGLGVFVGTKKADFSFKWAEAYHRNFGGPQGGFLGMGNMMGGDFTVGNGVFGQIIKIDGQTLTINGQDKVEKNVIVENETTIRLQRTNKKLSDLKVGDNIVVMGEPNNNGQIEAELIRIIPGNTPPIPSTPINLNTN